MNERPGAIPPWVELLSAEHKKFYKGLGIEWVCKINGKIVGAQKFLHTVGILVGIDETGYEHRYCYGSSPEAYIAFSDWMAHGGEEPKNYNKKKGKL